MTRLSIEIIVFLPLRNEYSKTNVHEHAVIQHMQLRGTFCLGINLISMNEYLLHEVKSNGCLH